MCKECGCGKESEAVEIEHDHDGLGPHKHVLTHSHEHGHGGHIHSHQHSHEHSHAHGHDDAHSRHDHEHSHHFEEELRKIRLETKVLADNDKAAEENAAFFALRGITALNIISSPGSGKTMLLERTLEQLSEHIPSAVIVGDQQTDNDAKRLENRGAPVLQLETGNTCHLDAKRVHAALDKVIEAKTRLLFIENIGNLICPAAFSLGERLKIVLLAVTEGEDKPLKYASTFSGADLVVITKSDLAQYTDFNRERCLDSIRRVAPRTKVIELSAKTGAGMPEWLNYLKTAAAEGVAAEA